MGRSRSVAALMVRPMGCRIHFCWRPILRPAKSCTLDFDGHHSVNNSWGHDIVFPPFNRQGSSSSFTNSELLEIQETFQKRRGGFCAVDVNITTRDPGVAALSRTGSNDPFYGVRALATQATAGLEMGSAAWPFLGVSIRHWMIPYLFSIKGQTSVR